MKQTIKNFFLKKILFKKGIKVLKNKKGFSLIEIMVALGLLVVVGGIAAPQYTAYQKKARWQAINATVNQIERAVGACVAMESDVSSCFTQDVKGTIVAKDGITIEVAEKTGPPAEYCFLVKEKGGTAKVVVAGKYSTHLKFEKSTGKKLTGVLLDESTTLPTANLAAFTCT